MYGALCCSGVIKKRFAPRAGEYVPPSLSSRVAAALRRACSRGGAAAPGAAAAAPQRAPPPSYSVEAVRAGHCRPPAQHGHGTHRTAADNARGRARVRGSYSSRVRTSQVTASRATRARRRAATWVLFGDVAPGAIAVAVIVYIVAAGVHAAAAAGRKGCCTRAPQQRYTGAPPPRRCGLMRGGLVPHVPGAGCDDRRCAGRCRRATHCAACRATHDGRGPAPPARARCMPAATACH